MNIENMAGTDAATQTPELDIAKDIGGLPNANVATEIQKQSADKSDTKPPSSAEDGEADNPDAAAPAPDDANAAELEPRVQLPAMLRSEFIALYCKPREYSQNDLFFLDVHRGLPPGYAFDEQTCKIYTCSNDGRLLPLCGPIMVAALIRSDSGNHWSREVHFLDLDGVRRSLVIAASDLIMNARGVVAGLMDLGFDVLGDPASVALMIRSASVDERSVSLKKPGWTEGTPPVFALPTGEILARQSADAETFRYHGPLWKNAPERGELSRWQTELAAYAVGNPIAVFALSLAFVGPMLPILKMKSVGFHIFGRSSCGKSTIASLAQSVWRNTVLQGWDVTIPALERLCLAGNQTFTVLDELPAKSKICLGEALYLIFNGANRSISADRKENRSPESWEVSVLSTGEEPSKDVLARSTSSVRAGHLVRLVDIDLSSAGDTLFPELHGFADSAAFVSHLEQNLARYSGTAGRAFVAELVTESLLKKVKIQKLYEGIDHKLKHDLLLNGAPLQGEVNRVLARFAAVATAGLVATKLGILPWPPHEAYNAVFKLAQNWLRERGGNVSSETNTIVSRTRDFLIRFGGTRFQTTEDARAGRRLADLAGWVDGDCFHFTSEAFRTAIAIGTGADRAARCLLEAGYLNPGNERGSLQGRMGSGVKDHGMASSAKDRPRCYSVKTSIFAA